MCISNFGDGTSHRELCISNFGDGTSFVGLFVSGGSNRTGLKVVVEEGVDVPIQVLHCGRINQNVLNLVLLSGLVLSTYPR